MNRSDNDPGQRGNVEPNDSLGLTLQRGGIRFRSSEYGKSLSGHLTDMGGFWSLLDPYLYYVCNYQYGIPLDRDLTKSSDFGDSLPFLDGFQDLILLVDSGSLIPGKQPSDSSSHIVCIGGWTCDSVTDCWQKFQSGPDWPSYVELRDLMVKRAAWKHRFLWPLLAYGEDDLTAEIDLHVGRKLSGWNEHGELLAYLRTVIDHKLRDMRMMAKRRLEAQPFIEDGAVAASGSKLNSNDPGLVYDLDLLVDVKHTLIRLCRLPGGRDAVLQLLGVVEPDSATRARISRFHIALASELGWTAGQAREWVATLVDVFVSQR